MRESGYQIVDEPRPGPMARVTVDPLWPLLGFMLGGVWLGWVWFAVNGHAMGSPTRRREVLLVVAGIAGVVALAALVAWAVHAGVLPQKQLWAGLLLITLWKLGVSYWLFALQRRTFDLYRYFGGAAANGIWVVAAGYFLRPTVAGLLPNGLWRLLLI
jgi:hypothetical protein